MSSWQTRIPAVKLWGLYVLGGLGLAYLLVATVLDKGVSWLDRVVAIAVGLAALLALLRLSFPKGVKAQELTRPKQGAQLMNVVLGVFGVMSAAVGLMAPRPVVESQAGIIEGTLLAMRGDVREIRAGQQRVETALGIGQPSLIRTAVAGDWGEEGCAAVRRFAFTGGALEVTTVRTPSGVPPQRWAFTIEAETNTAAPAGSRAATLTVTEQQGLFPGQSVKFHYRSDGVTQRLVWDGANELQPTLELVPCGRSS